MTGTKEEHFHYLDRLRESGVTNMLGAGVYLQRRFGMTKKEANDRLWEWIDSFKNDGGREERGP